MYISFCNLELQIIGLDSHDYQGKWEAEQLCCLDCIVQIPSSPRSPAVRQERRVNKIAKSRQEIKTCKNWVALSGTFCKVYFRHHWNCCFSNGCSTGSSSVPSHSLKELFQLQGDRPSHFRKHMSLLFPRSSW